MDQYKHSRKKSTCMRHSCVIYFTLSLSLRYFFFSSLLLLIHSFLFDVASKKIDYRTRTCQYNNVHTIFIRFIWMVFALGEFIFHITSTKTYTYFPFEREREKKKKLNEWCVRVRFFYPFVFFFVLRFLFIY